MNKGFTMIELIFVVIIIGILAATAVPKFTDSLDNAKANSELSAMSSLDSTIVAKKYFRYKNYKDSNVTWNDRVIDGAGSAAIYKSINGSKGVLKAIMDKGEKFKIIGYANTARKNASEYAYNDILFITGPASDSINGLRYPNDAPNSDIAGKPDKNDFWVFNPNNYDINVTYDYPGGKIGVVAQAIVSAKSVSLIDVNGANATVVGSGMTVRIVGYYKSIYADNPKPIVDNPKPVN